MEEDELEPLGELPPEPHLVMLDADRIHDYVFAPHQLRLIRGGSAKQLDLAETVLWHELRERGAQRIFAGGGTVMGVFSGMKAADAFCRYGEERFYTATGGAATVTGAAQAWLGEGDDGFRSTLLALRAKLEREKNARNDHCFAGSRPYWKVCEACGLHSATASVPAPVVPKAFCGPCLLRWKEDKTPYLERANNARKTPRRLKAPKDFNSLADGSKPEGYLALIYIDGDAMGRYLIDHGAKSRATYRNLSRRVRETFQEGVIEACAKVSPAEGTAPFEILLTGGDDALVMMQAQLALDFVAHFHQRFQAAPLDPPTTYSVAIVFAHASFPIPQFLNHADELLRSAKKRRGECSADFKAITEALADPDVDRSVPSTAKPYSIEELTRLAQTVTAWKTAGVPRNKVNALYRMAYGGRMQAELDYWQLLSRLEERHKTLLRSFFGTSFWRDGKTKAADLVELWSFVQP